MKEIFFLIAFILFSLLEICITLYFIKGKNSFAAKSVFIPFLLFCLYLIMDTVFKINIPSYALYLIIISLTIQSFFGYYKNLFLTSKVFDRYLHAYGAFSFAIFSYSIISHVLRPSVSPKLYAAIFVFALGIAAGAIYEIIEFWEDQKSAYKQQKGLQDTDFDLLFDTIGALLASVVSYFFIL